MSKSEKNLEDLESTALSKLGDEQSAEEMSEDSTRELEEFAGEVLERLERETSSEEGGTISRAMYAGPLPPPQMLAQYEETLPGMADRIMSMAEKEQGIRSRDNGWLVFNDFCRVAGSVAVSLGLVSGAIYCGVIDQPELGIALAASGLVPQIIKHFNGKDKSDN